MNWHQRFRQWGLAALTIWLLVGLVGVHGHFCFDGQEPPVSMHFDIIGGHDTHSPSEAHEDVDVDLSQSVQIKSPQQDLVLPLLIALVIIFLILPNHFAVIRDVIYGTARISGLRPPLRAPPASLTALI